MKAEYKEKLFRKYLNEPPESGREVEQVATLFSHFPYENFSKFIAWIGSGESEPPLRMGEQVVDEHLRYGLGGTCFSLTQAAFELLKEMGIESTRITGRMKAGDELHSALIVPLQSGEKWLLDPGYLLPGPLPVHSDKVTTVERAGKLYRVTPESGDLTIHIDGEWKACLHHSGASDDRFMTGWRNSFSRMRDMIATLRRGDEIIYLRNDFLRMTGPEGKRQSRLKENFVETVSALFCLPPETVRKAAKLYLEARPWKKLRLKI